MQIKRLSVLTLIRMTPNKLGGLEEYALSLSRELLARGQGAAVGFRQYPPGWLQERFEAENIPALRFDHSRGAFHFARSVRAAIRANGFNILHTTFYPCYDWIFPAAILGTECKLIQSDQVSRVNRPSKGLYSIPRFLKRMRDAGSFVSF